MSQPLPFLFTFAAAPGRILFKPQLILNRPLVQSACAAKVHRRYGHKRFVADTPDPPEAEPTAMNASEEFQRFLRAAILERK